ncbi:hypothetical protein HMPREF2811_07955 [Globicatella sp. HMSC072A10]|nr:hypothetical protein HMPREF2811_07955 [Globicatella sp. HMSC072A10]
MVNLIIGGIIGWLAGLLLGKDIPGGVIGNIIAGLLGSAIGEYLFHDTGFIASFLGAVILIIVFSFINKNRQ